MPIIEDRCNSPGPGGVLLQGSTYLEFPKHLDREAINKENNKQSASRNRGQVSGGTTGQFNLAYSWHGPVS